MHQAFDSDGSGALDVSELVELLQMLTRVSAGDRHAGGFRVGGIKAAMEEMDKGNNGKVAEMRCCCAAEKFPLHSSSSNSSNSFRLPPPS